MSNVINLNTAREDRTVYETGHDDNTGSGPQIENGHTRIANELFEALLLADITKNQLKIMLAIIRKTYGWGKKSDRITNIQLAALTDIKYNKITTIVSDLLTKNMLCREGGKFGKLGIQKKYLDWENNPKTGWFEKSAKKTEQPQNGVVEQPQNGVVEQPQNGVTQKKLKEIKEKDSASSTETKVSYEQAQSCGKPSDDAPKKTKSVGWESDTISNRVDWIFNQINQISGRRFTAKKPNGDLTAIGEMAKQRIKDGYCAKDFLAVIKYKWHQVQTDDFDAKYFQPSTLLRPSNFPGYRDAALSHYGLTTDEGDSHAR